MTLRIFILLLAVTGFAAGCGDSGPELAPVSGVVTLDGNPVPQAIVTFQPIGSTENPNPGVGSRGQADAEGRYELKTTIDEESGAIVGQHRVLITTPAPPQAANNDSGIGQPVHKEIIPAKYNTATELTYDVPADGTDAANFQLTTP